MKESRIIIIALLFMILIIGPIFYVLYYFDIVSYTDCFNIATNLYCGVAVGLVTAICQHCISRKRIINSIYNLYLDLYWTYCCSKKRYFLFHYSTFKILKKMIEISPKINECLDEYHGLLIKKDKMYEKMNPDIVISDELKGKNFLKTTFWFNKSYFEKTFGSYMDKVEKILINIDEKRFNKDKEEMEKLYNCLWK